MKNLIKKERFKTSTVFLICPLVMTIFACGTTSEIRESDPPTFGTINYTSANPEKGFNYGYFYYIPISIKDAPKKFILLEPNNTGGFRDYTNSDTRTHEQAALRMLNDRKTWADELSCLLFVPAIPRPYSTPPFIEQQALNRIALQTKTGKSARVDLQVIQMIEDLKELCKTIGIDVETKVLIEGFSAGGHFGNRFTALHPEIVQAVASGGISQAILPIDIMDREKLIYPVGIQDIEKITGTSFNLQQYINVPQFIYVGSADTNDPALYSQHMFGDEERRIILKILGRDMIKRYEICRRIYEEQGCTNAKFVVYDGVGHTINNRIQGDIIAFFKSNMN